MAIFQLPVARFLNRFSHIQALIFSLLLWGLGFILIFITGIVENYALIWAILALLVDALAMAVYNASAFALILDLSSPSFRATYLSINSHCWAIGYLIGPPLGGWILDQSPHIVYSFWLAAAASILVGVVSLKYLEVCLKK